METAGYFAAVLIGISLGLIGGGGSILTVPVLVYLFGIHAALATTYSLFIVGATSTMGAVSYLIRKQADVKTGLVFGIPSIITVYVVRSFLVPAIPEMILQTERFSLTKNTFLLLLFAVVMIPAAYSMIRKRKNNTGTRIAPATFNYPFVIATGAGVGLLTGMIGAGGGFLIIPALVNFLKIPIKTAIGTSLMIIAINALLGFLFSLGYTPVAWVFLFKIAGIAMAGIWIGSKLASTIDGKKLKPAFGWFVLIMGIGILLREILA